jgi:hypothetical protein
MNQHTVASFRRTESGGFKCHACGVIARVDPGVEYPPGWVTVSAEVVRPSDGRRVTTPCMVDQACSLRCAADLLRGVVRVVDEIYASDADG